MSLSEGRGRSTMLGFLMERVKRDLQFSNIFLVDLAASMAYAAVTVFFLSREDTTDRFVAATFTCAFIYALLHAGKILLIVHLERQGGDARQFVGSEELVTSGVYSWSRNPVYLISLVQSVFWSLGLVFLAADSSSFWIALILAPLLAYAHYWGQDQLIIPNEEAALLKRHPQAFAAYCARVNRWFGRKG